MRIEQGHKNRLPHSSMRVWRRQQLTPVGFPTWHLYPRYKLPVSLNQSHCDQLFVLFLSNVRFDSIFHQAVLAHQLAKDYVFDLLWILHNMAKSGSYASTPSDSTAAAPQQPEQYMCAICLQVRVEKEFWRDGKRWTSCNSCEKSKTKT